MPPRHHRTVDRIVAILELVARAEHGLSLAEICTKMGVPKSSIQELTNGLLATGYLVERDRRMILGAGPFVLTLMGNRLAALSLTHEIVEDLYTRVGSTVLIGVVLGDAVTFIDYAGEEESGGSLLEFVARTHSRRSMLATASGKIALSEMPYRQMDALLVGAHDSSRTLVERFLHELPSIRSSGLAYNFGVTVPGVSVVSTALRDSHGRFVASVSSMKATLDVEEMSDLGARLLAAVRAVKL